MLKEKNKGLYESKFEHDNCGIGFVANLKNKKSHKTVIAWSHPFVIRDMIWPSPAFAIATPR